MKTIYLDEEFRTPGTDHLDQYRNSPLYNLLNKSIKERGNAYEQIACKILQSKGLDCIISTKSHGAYDLIVDGNKVELKSSRKASQYDTRKRSYQFPYIREDGYDSIMLMVMTPEDIIHIYWTDFKTIQPYLGATDKLKSSWNLSVNPADIGLTPFASVNIQ